MSFQICVHLSFFLLPTFHLFFSVSVHQTVQTATATTSELRLAVQLVWTAGTRRQSAEKYCGRMTRWAQENGLQEGPLVVGCGDAKAHWVALQSAENWKFTTNTWRQKVGRTQPEIGILQWEYRVGIWCQYDENMDPPSFMWTLQAEIFIQSDCVHTFMTTVEHLLLDQPEGKCISGTVCSLFSSCFVFWSHNFKRLSASLIPNQ